VGAGEPAKRPPQPCISICHIQKPSGIGHPRSNRYLSQGGSHSRKIKMPLAESHRLRRGRFSEPGRLYMLTTITHQRKPLFRDFHHARLVVKHLRVSDDIQDCRSLAWVVMPDHLHWLIELKEVTGNVDAQVQITHSDCLAQGRCRAKADMATGLPGPCAAAGRVCGSCSPVHCCQSLEGWIGQKYQGLSTLGCGMALNRCWSLRGHARSHRAQRNPEGCDTPAPQGSAQP